MELGAEWAYVARFDGRHHDYVHVVTQQLGATGADERCGGRDLRDGYPRRSVLA